MLSGLIPRMKRRFMDSKYFTIRNLGLSQTLVQDD
jgi:hypothetical protein